MKKQAIALVFCTILVIPGLMVSSCSERKLDSDTELQIREAYLQYCQENNMGTGRGLTLTDIRITSYLGKFSGCDAVGIYYVGQMIPHNDYVEVAGYTIVYAQHSVLLYKNLKLYTIKEAYAARLITYNDVYKLGNKVSIRPL